MPSGQTSSEPFVNYCFRRTQQDRDVASSMHPFAHKERNDDYVGGLRQSVAFDDAGILLDKNGFDAPVGALGSNQFHLMFNGFARIFILGSTMTRDEQANLFRSS